MNNLLEDYKRLLKTSCEKDKKIVILQIYLGYTKTTFKPVYRYICNYDRINVITVGEVSLKTLSLTGLSEFHKKFRFVKTVNKNGIKEYSEKELQALTACNTNTPRASGYKNKERKNGRPR